MTDTRQIRRKTKGYVDVSKLDDGTVLKITDAGRFDEIQRKDGTKATVYRLGVQLGAEDPSGVTLNSTTLNTLDEAWGTETKDWVGKELEVYHVQQLLFGELKQVGLLRPKGSKPKAEARKAK